MSTPCPRSDEDDEPGRDGEALGDRAGDEGRRDHRELVLVQGVDHARQAREPRDGTMHFFPAFITKDITELHAGGARGFCIQMRTRLSNLNRISCIRRQFHVHQLQPELELPPAGNAPR